MATTWPQLGRSWYCLPAMNRWKSLLHFKWILFSKSGLLVLLVTKQPIAFFHLHAKPLNINITLWLAKYLDFPTSPKYSNPSNSSRSGLYHTISFIASSAKNNTAKFWLVCHYINFNFEVSNKSLLKPRSILSFVTLLWSVLTDGNKKTLANNFNVCGLEWRINNGKDLSWTVHLLPWLLRLDNRGWDDTKSRAGPDICSADSFTNWATDMSSVAVTLSWVALITFDISLLIFTRILDVHTLSFFFLLIRSLDGDHRGPTVNTMYVI